MSTILPNPPTASETPTRREESAPYEPPSRLGWTARLMPTLRDREAMLRLLRTIAWVVPLTVLIWVYAEREQFVPPADVYVPIELATDQPNCLLTLKNSSDRTVAVEITGPRAGLNVLKSTYLSGSNKQAVRIVVRAKDLPPPGSPNRDLTVLIADAIQSDEMFRKSAVKVTRVSPPAVGVSVDWFVTRRLPVEAWDEDVMRLGLGKVNIVAEPVEVRAPGSLFEKGIKLAMRADLTALKGAGPGRHENVELPISFAGADQPVQAPAKVRATVEIKPPDTEQLRIASLPIWTLTPAKSLTLRSNTVEYDPAEIKNIVVSGPPDKLQELQKASSDFRACVVLQITDEDLQSFGTSKADGKIRKITAKDIRLPEGVQVESIEGGHEAPVTFWLSPRTN